MRYRHSFSHSHSVYIQVTSKSNVFSNAKGDVYSSETLYTYFRLKQGLYSILILYKYIVDENMNCIFAASRYFYGYMHKCFYLPNTIQFFLFFFIRIFWYFFLLYINIKFLYVKHIQYESHTINSNVISNANVAR